VHSINRLLTGDLRRVFRAIMVFHRALFALSDSEVLTEAIREYEGRTHSIRSVSIVFPQYLEKARIEHHQMIDALRRRPRQVDRIVPGTRRTAARIHADGRVEFLEGGR